VVVVEMVLVELVSQFQLQFGSGSGGVGAGVVDEAEQGLSELLHYYYRHEGGLLPGGNRHPRGRHPQR
jgi:hypothetical protein